MAVFPVVLDSNVLYNAAVRDTLLRAAAVGLYRPHWSEKIVDDAIRNMRDDGRLRTDVAADALRGALSRHFPEAPVEVPEALTNAMPNHPGDRHVAAAAVVAHAQVIVTFNTRHFDPADLSSYGIEAQHPDAFLEHLLDLDRFTMRRILLEQAEDLTRPPMDICQLLQRLGQDVPKFAAQAGAMFPMDTAPR